MKLIYMYVENPVKGVIGKNLNFSSRYEIKLDKITKAGGKTTFHLQLLKKQFYDDILYGKNVEVFGIVGDNGMGKSSVLDYIRRIHYDCASLSDEVGIAFSIWEDKGEFILYKISPVDKIILIDLRECISMETIYLAESRSMRSSTGIVYYSDIVDEKYVYNKFNGKCIDNKIFREQGNVSTAHYISETLALGSSGLLRKNNMRTLRNYFHNEVERELFFIWDVSEKDDKLKDWYHIPSNIEMIFTLTNFSVVEKEILQKSLSNYSSDLHHVSNGSLEETSFIRIAKLLKKEYDMLKNVSYKMNKGIRCDKDDGILAEMRIGYNCIMDMLLYLNENIWDDVKWELDEAFDEIIDEIDKMFPKYKSKRLIKRRPLY